MEVKLYDANGAQTGTAEAEDEPGREGVVEHGGKVYIWNQRNAQWREAAASVKLKAAPTQHDLAADVRKAVSGG